jgi:biopolymer transport protein TolR
MQVGRNDKRGLAEINVTPLVDVMLVLLIIFMVSAPMMQQGVPLNLPKADAAPTPSEENEITISVQSDRRIFLGEVETDAKSLEAQLRQMRANDPGRKVFLRADESVNYGTVVRVLASAERAGVSDLGMLTDPEEK